jgi:membrane protein
MLWRNGRTGAWLGALREAFSRWIDDDCLRLAASLSYYAIFSIFPLLLLLATAIGHALGDGSASRRDLLDWLTGQTGSPAVRTLLDETLSNLQSQRTARGIGALVGLVALLFGASGVFSELDSALNTIWRVQDPPSPTVGRQVLTLVARKSWSFLLVMVASVLVLASWLGSLATAGMSEAMREVLPRPLRMAFGWVDLAVSAFVLTAVLAATYRTLPRTRVAWRDVLPGALFAAVLLTALKRLLAFYVAHLSGYAAYGALGAILGLMTLIYVSSLVMFFGAELTRVYAERFGSLVDPGQRQREGRLSRSASAP